MRNLFLNVLVCGSLLGCGATWFQDFKSNPIHQINAVLDSSAAIEQTATVVFDQLEMFLPREKQSLYRSKFDGSLVALQTAKGALRSALSAAAEAQQQKPDLTKAIADVVSAVSQVKAVVDEVRELLKAPPVAAAPGTVAAPALTMDPVGYAELNTLVESFKP